MKIASFFSGIGGLELGLERALDAETVFQCESNDYARRVLAKHWPAVQRHGDITALRPDEIPSADLWCGGFPCQDISVAGKGVGIHGQRSGLWWTWLDLIRVVRPRILVLENVAALASRGLDEVLGSLAELGYDAEWARIGAVDVGAPHRRWRIFIIATLRDSDSDSEPARPVDDEASRVQGDGSNSTGQRQRAGRPDRGDAQPARNGAEGAAPSTVADADNHVRHGRGRAVQVGWGEGTPDDAGQWRVRDGTQWRVEPDVGRVAHGISYRLDRLRCLGNAVVPQVAYQVGLRVREIMHGDPR